MMRMRFFLIVFFCAILSACDHSINQEKTSATLTSSSEISQSSSSERNSSSSVCKVYPWRGGNEFFSFGEPFREDYSGECKDGIADGFGYNSWQDSDGLGFLIGLFHKGYPAGIGHLSFHYFGEYPPEYHIYSNWIYSNLSGLIPTGPTMDSRLGVIILSEANSYPKLYHYKNGFQYGFMNDFRKCIDSTGATKTGLASDCFLPNFPKFDTLAAIYNEIPELRDSVSRLEKMLGDNFPQKFRSFAEEIYPVGDTIRRISINDSEWIGEIRFSNGTIYQGHNRPSDSTYPNQSDSAAALIASIAKAVSLHYLDSIEYLDSVKSETCTILTELSNLGTVDEQDLKVACDKLRE